MNETILTVKNLSKKYNDFCLDGINLELKKGSITGYIGQNGAGKSTTIKSILNVINYDQGEVLFKGQKYKSDKINLKLKIGYVGEHHDIYNSVKTKKIYKFVKNLYHDYWNDEKFYYYINKIFNVNLNKRMNQLSKGMKTKFLIALSLSHEPELLLLDEPTSGLDPLIREEVLDVLFSLSKEDFMTILFSSHITEDIEKIASNIVYIDNGKILLNTTKDELHSRYKKIKIEFLDHSSFQKFKSKGIIRKEYIFIDTTLFKENLLKKYKLEKVLLDEILSYLMKLREE